MLRRLALALLLSLESKTRSAYSEVEEGEWTYCVSNLVWEQGRTTEAFDVFQMVYPGSFKYSAYGRELFAQKKSLARYSKIQEAFEFIGAYLSKLRLAQHSNYESWVMTCPLYKV